ncbi:hypothetical protein EW026_g8302 [Hermanssonia centrifuga]|uniref:Uncharacterized protein n=1 Tax=Hermanssonia centrifuga TaxID=98765 RepID=A0A4S4K909_9APHY|nr:hypothetical protein EW026_g8302 [Hermanssonia centrifuga]
MATYTLTVNVDSADLGPLKEAGYKLCTAKRVNDKYNVVWSGAEYIYTSFTSRFNVANVDAFAT